uniref:Putative secreted protein n=1 Tax=Ixodes ricinus TaxID=34613 RepID=A0A6B0U199_IXORI
MFRPSCSRFLLSWLPSWGRNCSRPDILPPPLGQCMPHSATPCLHWTASSARHSGHFLGSGTPFSRSSDAQIM